MGLKNQWNGRNEATEIKKRIEEKERSNKSRDSGSGRGAPVRERWSVLSLQSFLVIFMSVWAYFWTWKICKCGRFQHIIHYGLWCNSAVEAAAAAPHMYNHTHMHTYMHCCCINKLGTFLTHTPSYIWQTTDKIYSNLKNKTTKSLLLGATSVKSIFWGPLVVDDQIKIGLKTVRILISESQQTN